MDLSKNYTLLYYMHVWEVDVLLIEKSL